MIRKTVGPLSLMISTPILVLLFWYINAHCKGSFSFFLYTVKADGIGAVMIALVAASLIYWKSALSAIGIFAVSQLILMKLIPGKRYSGPTTPKGNVPLYRDNGFLSFVITVASFFLFGSVFKLFPLTILYDSLGSILLIMTLFSLVFCFLLYMKGRFFPSSTDCQRSGNFIFDFYWGIELYPRLFGWDIKQFTNCRFGMMLWPLLILSYAAKQYSLYGLISSTMLLSVVLQMVYIAIFFFWESGYMKSLDIMHDRAGYYICWGCLTWVPGFYTLPSFFLVQHPKMLSPLMTLGLIALGLVCLWVNYDANAQRKKVRTTNGKCTIWGKEPKLIEAKYATESGVEKESLLLFSGWWGISRHFHYIPEILGAILWSAPFYASPMPWLYPVFLTILLLDRAMRDHKRCQNKYGDYWDQYCQKVPYKVIPYIY